MHPPLSRVLIVGAMNVLASFFTCGKYYGRKQCKKERVYWLLLPRHDPSVREPRAGTWKQEPQKNAVGCLPLGSLEGTYPATYTVAFLYSSEPPSQGWYCLQWAGPFYISESSRQFPTISMGHSLMEATLLR